MHRVWRGERRLAQGWRAYLAPDEEEPEGEILTFSPECAEREFGPSGWEGNALD
jgi:hypothetical protein